MISCDSMQVYKSMPITTQQPPRAVTKALKTHLVSFLSPSRRYSAAHFRKDALALIKKILKKGKTPLIVGGTGLYLRALLDGLFEGEGSKRLTDESLRKRLAAEQAAHGGNYLHEKLRKADPVSAKKIHPNDLRRLIRALEVFHFTGKPFSEQKANRKGVRDDFEFRIFLLDRDRADLYERVNRRVDEMIKEGLVKEVKGLLRKRLSLTAKTALGIREIKTHLEGKCTFEEAAALLKKNTRNYAKRQLSWFRHERGAELVHIAPDESASQIAFRIVSHPRMFLSGIKPDPRFRGDDICRYAPRNDTWGD